MDREWTSMIVCFNHKPRNLRSVESVSTMMLNTILAAVSLLSQGVEIGKPVPDVSLTDMDGKTVRLSQFRGKKLILFNWASW